MPTVSITDEEWDMVRERRGVDEKKRLFNMGVDEALKVLRKFEQTHRPLADVIAAILKVKK